jgi:hypothetical protein
MRRAMADPAAANYTDEALNKTGVADLTLPDMVRAYSGKIPRNSYGAPVSEDAAA